MDTAEKSSDNNSDRNEEISERMVDKIKSFKEAGVIPSSAWTGALALAACSFPLSVSISIMFRPDFPGFGIFL